jgi:hypothetical protein
VWLNTKHRSKNKNLRITHIVEEKPQLKKKTSTLSSKTPNLLQPPSRVSSTCTIPQPLQYIILIFIHIFYSIHFLFTTPNKSHTENKNLYLFSLSLFTLSIFIFVHLFYYGSTRVEPISHRFKRLSRSGSC